ncbi:MAG: hypothetical protein AAF514_12660, partial [Verrucomicrobiota bacterium]
MSAQTLSSDNGAPRVLSDKLSSLRQRVFWWFSIDGLRRVLLTILIIIPIDLALDWYFRMDKAQRGVMLVISLAIIAWVAWRYLVKPLMARLTDQALLLEVEKQNGGLSDKLINALEFSRPDWSKNPNISQELVEASIEEGREIAEEVSFKGVLRQGSFFANTALLDVIDGIEDEDDFEEEDVLDEGEGQGEDEESQQQREEAERAAAER